MKVNNTYGNCFKVKFNILDYADIYPTPPTDITQYINWDKPVEECVWKKDIPDVITPRYREQEIRRVLREGVWIIIKEMPIWIPPNYYFALKYGKAGSADMEFRLKRLKHVYFKIRARLNKGCKGTITMKNRGDGETTMAIHDGFWECLDGNMETGQIGIQSKTRMDAINPCWGYIQTLWQSLPLWFKNDLCGDFSSGDSIATKMEWQRSANEQTGTKARNILYTYYPSGTSMDGKHDMKKCILDEINKWEECSFYDVFTNYSKFIMPGFQRRGMFDMFSSPADKPCASNLEVYALWKDSNTDEITNNGTTKSRVHRYYSDPLEGIAGAYDKYGDADPKEIYDFIMAERAKVPKDKLFAEIRGYPLNEEEMFGSTDEAKVWDNHKGIADRVVYLVGCKVKNTKDNEPVTIYGNYEWRDGIPDTEVDFRVADLSDFDVDVARICHSYILRQEEKDPLKYKTLTNGERVPLPPNVPLVCLGIDPYDYRHSKGSGLSNGAMVAQKIIDPYETGIIKCPIMICSIRPSHPDIFYEDAIKAAVFNRALVQVENKNRNIINYFEDRGYIDWMLSKIGEAKNSPIKGDAPSGGKNAFLSEIVMLLNAITNKPLNPGEKYNLEQVWFSKLLEDMLKFNIKDTHTNDLTMAWGQSLMGALKIMKRKKRSHDPNLAGVLTELFG